VQADVLQGVNAAEPQRHVFDLEPVHAHLGAARRRTLAEN
jgi:hypothetical protein